MKKIFLVVMLCGLSFLALSQNAGVEPSCSGIQTGFLGIWGHNEIKFSNSIVFRSEFGFDSGIWGGSYYEKTGFLMTPVLSATPRWYYNLKKRETKSKRVDGSSGNFLALKTSFHPDWFVISNYEDIQVISDISIVPTWGIRRNIGRHFNYESGFGIGFRYIFAKQSGYLENEGDVAVNLHLRIGYRF
ncbi:MAG: hypothetical protein ACK5M7_19180 [Draconibacterium sp.]